MALCTPLLVSDSAFLDYQGKLLDTYYNHESLAQGIEGYSYEQLTEAFGGDKAIYVLFTLYDGSVGRETLVRVM